MAFNAGKAIVYLARLAAARPSKTSGILTRGRSSPADVVSANAR